MTTSCDLQSMFKSAGIPTPVPSNIKVEGLNYDSRLVKPGDLFFAIKGVHVDGHQFLDDVQKKGAVAAIVHKKTLSSLPQFEVPSMPEAMARLSDIYYEHPSRKIPVVGITGTNGKTTCTYIMENILKENGQTCGVMGTINYRLGGENTPAPNTTPMSLDVHRFISQAVSASASAVIMEVSSHALEQSRVLGVQFAVGVFTNLTQDHLDFHKDMETYFKAKGRLFRDFSGIKKVINVDDPYGKRLKREFEDAVTYGFEAGASLRASAETSSLKGLEFDLTFPSQKTYRIKSNLMGHHNIENLMAAGGAMFAFGIPEDVIVRGLNRPQHVPGRFERVDMGQDFVVLVDYAHTEDALFQAMKTLKALKPRRMISVFGAGGDRDRTKRPKMGKVAAKFSDHVVITSDNPRSEDPKSILNEIETGFKEVGFENYDVEPDRKKAILLAVKKAGPNDIVLIAGKGHETYQIYKDKKFHFSDVEEAKESLKIIRGK